MATVSRILSRSFSSTSVGNQLVKVPIQVFGIEGRYASALYTAATKEKQLEQVEKDIKELHTLLKKKGTFADFLLNPSMKRTEKTAFLASTLSQTKASKLSANLLVLLAENGRLNKLDSIATSFSTIMSAHRGEVECEVITAKPLDAALLKELESTLKSFVKSDQSIILKTKVDASLLGGMVVSIGDKYVDMSTASKLKKYSELIQMAV